MAIIETLIKGYKQDLEKIEQQIKDLDTELFRNHIKQLKDLNEAKNILVDLIEELEEL